MLSIWIIHRDPEARAAIARISGVGERAVLAAPTDRVLERAEAPTVVVLGLTGDFEIELDFVHRHAERLAGCDWILLADAADTAEARRLFDTLPSRVLPYPPEPRALRRALRASVQQRHADPLSARQGRAELHARFARWFGDLELPELIRALDPRLSRVPVLIHGEEGTGRGLLARYVHASAGRTDESFVQVTCREDTRAQELLRQIRLADGTRPSHALTFYFEDVDRLPVALQHRLRDWIEFGLPDGAVRRHGHRFMASAASVHELDGAPGLDPRLAETLSGLTLSLPPLRERASHVASFVVDTASAIARGRGEPARRFSPDALDRLAAYPWPGNLHELEAVVTRTLSFTSANPIEPIHLRFPADVDWLEEPLGRAEFEPESTRRPAAPRSESIPRPTAFPNPLASGVTPSDPGTTTHRIPIDAEPLEVDAAHQAARQARETDESVETFDALDGLDPGAAPGHEDDLELERVATLGATPVSLDALERDIDAQDEENLFPEEDLDDAAPSELDEAFDGFEGDEAEEGEGEEGEAGEEAEDEPAHVAHDAFHGGLRAVGEGLLHAELLDRDEADETELEELFAEVELIDAPGVAVHDPFAPALGIDPDVEVSPSELLPDLEALPTELRRDAEPEAPPSELRPDVEAHATELLPDVEPLAPPVRPLPEAGDSDARAAALAEDALPFREPFTHQPADREPAAARRSGDRPRTGADARLYELVGAIAHEVRNPLVSIRTFSELLPDHYDDPEFRDHFRELVVKDVQRIDRVVARLQSLAEGQRKPEPVDMARLLDRLLDERRPIIQSRRLLVLKELDHTQPTVLADAEQIEDAIAGLVDRAIEQASERGDVYLASRYDDGGHSGRARVRVLIRHTRASTGSQAETRVAIPSSDQAMLDLVLAKRLIEAQGGELVVDDAEAGESVIVIDLPAA